jgi:uncharacterized membrane protein
MKGCGDTRSPSSQVSGLRSVRWLLILLILIAFGRLAWQLDAKSLWWDESLSLQRAESPLPSLLLGRFVFDDGVTRITSDDQHPFVYFVLLGALLRLAGQSDFVLRFPSVVSATLLVPMTWALARLLVRRGALPPTTPIWAAMLVAVHPFYLWYGREARMYTLVPFLALLSTYLLLRWREVVPGPTARRYLAWYAFTLVLLLCTHYLALLILPIHAGLIFAGLAGRSRRRAILIAIGLLGLGLVLGLAAVWWNLKGHGSGTNFSRVPLPTMLQDLLNAFSLGLSVDTAQVRWLDYIFAAVALLGALWCIRPGRPAAREAWLLPAFLLVPVIGLQIMQQVQPAYMNARHLSLISGAFVLLVAGGIAAVGSYRRWAGVALAVVMLAGMAYSTVNYFISPRYAKDNFAELGADLSREIQPGDGLLLAPPEMVRLYRHYLPVDAVEMATLARTKGLTEPQRGWLAVPQFGAPAAKTEERLQAMLSQYRRIWLVASGMVPLSPFQGQAREWLSSHAFLARDAGYESNTFLWLKLYLPQAPVLSGLPETVQHPLTAVFGDKIRFSGYDIGQPLTGESATPITLYWQPLQPMDRHYKYILRVVTEEGTGSFRTLAITEREPYDGNLPTTMWGPGQTIVEYSRVAPTPRNRDQAPANPVRLALQMYDAETLEKLPVSQADQGEIAADGQTLLLPYAP